MQFPRIMYNEFNKPVLVQDAHEAESFDPRPPHKRTEPVEVKKEVIPKAKEAKKVTKKAVKKAVKKK